MSLHAKNCCADNGATTGRISSKVRHVSDLRHKSRRAASKFFGLVVASSGSVASAARHLGVSERQVTRWMDPDHEAALTLGDVLALPVAQCNQLLDMARAHRERDVASAHEDPIRSAAAILAAAAAAAQALAAHDPKATARAYRTLQAAVARASADLVPDSSRTPKE